MCIAPVCPEISCDGFCGRKNESKEKIFPALAYLSCDKNGEKKCCKTCVINCQKGHNIHFLEYSNFVCKCKMKILNFF